jgi:hypothetical protein
MAKAYRGKKPAVKVMVRRKEGNLLKGNISPDYTLVEKGSVAS